MSLRTSEYKKQQVMHLAYFLFGDYKKNGSTKEHHPCTTLYKNASKRSEISQNKLFQVHFTQITNQDDKIMIIQE